MGDPWNDIWEYEEDTDDEDWDFDVDLGYGESNDAGMVSLANDLAESANAEANYLIFLDNPTSRDLGVIDTFEDLILWELDHDDYYDKLEIDTISKRDSENTTPESHDQGKMDEDERQQQFPDSSATKSESRGAETSTENGNVVVTDSTDGVIPGSPQKKRTAAVAVLRDQEDPLDGKRLRLKPTDAGKATPRRTRTPAADNPNIGPKPWEKITVVYEDDKKMVLLVDTGSVTHKLRVVPKSADNKDWKRLELPVKPNPPKEPFSFASQQSESDAPTTYEKTELIIPDPPSTSE